MKVAQVTATFPPYLAGTGNVAYHNALLLHERGHDVTVFTAPLDAGHEDLSFPFKVERLEALFRVGNAPLLPSLANRLAGFDVVHLHYPFIFGSEAVLYGVKRSRLPLVVTYHNRLEEEHAVKQLLFKGYNLLVEPAVLARANRLIAVRANHFLSHHPKFRRGKLVEVPNGVDTGLFRPHDKREARAALGLDASAPTALFVGALDQAHRFKNVPGLLEAFARTRTPAAQLLVAGDGDLRPALEAYATKLGLAERVRFLGRKTPEALPLIYSAADLTVLPSTGVESFGMVLTESMACGTPVVTTALPGVRDLVDAGRDGLVVPVGDAAALAQALDTLLQNTCHAADMGRRAREKVIRTYDWKVIAGQLERVYEGLLSPKDRS